MKVAVLISRILLGLIFVVFGLNGFLHFAGAFYRARSQLPVPLG